MPVAGSADSPSAAHTDPYHPLYCCGHFHLSIKRSLTSLEKDLMEMMGKTQRERDRDQTNMGRLWIEDSSFYRRGVEIYVTSSLHRRKKKFGHIRDETGLKLQMAALTVKLQRPPVGLA